MKQRSKRLLSVLLSLAMLLGMVPGVAWAAGGTGTENDPILVGTEEEIKNAWTAIKDASATYHVKLTSNIDLAVALRFGESQTINKTMVLDLNGYSINNTYGFKGIDLRDKTNSLTITDTSAGTPGTVQVAGEIGGPGNLMLTDGVTLSCRDSVRVNNLNISGGAKLQVRTILDYSNIQISGGDAVLEAHPDFASFDIDYNQYNQNNQTITVSEGAKIANVKFIQASSVTVDNATIIGSTTYGLNITADTISLDANADLQEVESIGGGTVTIAENAKLAFRENSAHSFTNLTSMTIAGAPINGLIGAIEFNEYNGSFLDLTACTALPLREGAYIDLNGSDAIINIGNTLPWTGSVEVRTEGKTSCDFAQYDGTLPRNTAHFTAKFSANGNSNYTDADVVEATAEKKLSLKVMACKITREGVDNRFASLSEAFAAAQSGETIVLLRNLGAAEHTGTIALNGGVYTLDLAGHIIYGNYGHNSNNMLFRVNQGATLNLVDNDVEKSGGVHMPDHEYLILMNNGAVNIEGGSYYGGLCGPTYKSADSSEYTNITPANADAKITIREAWLLAAYENDGEPASSTDRMSVREMIADGFLALAPGSAVDEDFDWDSYSFDDEMKTHIHRTYQQLLSVDIKKDGASLGNTVPQVGDVLTADADGATPVAFQWYRDETPIEGASTATYTVAAEDAGCILSVRATQAPLEAGQNTIVKSDNTEAVFAAAKNLDLNKHYPTLQAAFDDARLTNDHTVQLLTDVNENVTFGGEAHSKTGATVTLDLNGKSVSGNEYTTVRIASGTLKLKDESETPGKITHVEGQSGSGVYVDAGATFVMNGGEISDNVLTDTGRTCGVVDVYGTFIMNGGKIRNNQAKEGTAAYAGVVVENNGRDIGTFTMSGGEISDNISLNVAGGVYAFGTFTMTGGCITGNVGNGGGSGVRVDSGASVTFGGTAKVIGNKRSDNTTENVFMLSERVMVSTATPFADGASVGITLLRNGEGKGVFTKEIANDTARDAAKPYFSSDNPKYRVLPTVAADNAANQLKLDVVVYAKLENLSIANSTEGTRDGSNGNPNPQILDALRAVATDNSDTTATPVTYQWYRADSKDGTYTAISDATGETYTTAAEDEGKYFKVVVTQSVDENLHSLTQSITKEAVIGPVVKPAVTVSGVTRYSRTLTPVLSPAVPAKDAAHFTYTWYRLSEPNAETGSSSADTGESYLLGGDDIGKYLQVVVSVDEEYAPKHPAFKDGRIFGTSEKIEPDEYITPVLTANKTVASADSGKGKIVINGFENYRSDGVYAFSPDDGKTWFTESGTIDGVTVTIEPRGEQTPLVTFTGLDVNATYYLRVRGEEKKQNGIVVIKQGTASNALPVKTPSSNISLESAAIDGKARVGDTLVAKIKPVNATIVRYEWFRGNDLTQPIENGTAYTLINKDYNKAITLKVTDANGKVETAVITVEANGGVTVQQAPAAKPNANSFRLIATTTGITVNGFANTSTRHYQYRLDSVDWQDGNTFSGLSANTSYTVSVRTGGPLTEDKANKIPANWQASSVENGYIVSQSVTTPANPNPFDGVALTVSMNGYTYGTPGIIPTLSSALKGGATQAWQYRAAGASNWQNWTASERLNVGTYEVRAVIAAVDGYSAYTTATTLFTVSPAKLPTPAASASGTTVTVTDDVPASRKVQFVVVDYDNPLGDSVTEWKTATLDGSDQFTLTGLKENYHYDVYLRSVPAADDVNHTYSDWSAKADGTTPETKTVVFDLNGGKVKSGSTFALTATFTESSYALPNGEALERTGYTFAGWKQDGGATVDSVTSGGTCAAQWTPISYSIAFDANGGSGETMAAVTAVNYGKAVRLSANTYTNGSNIFAGWATAANGKVAYLDGQSVMNLSATDGAQVTLYAVWKTASKVSGAVYSAETGKVELTLTQGNVQLGSVLILPLSPNQGASAPDGSDAYAQSYRFNNVPDGTYNLIARQSVERLGSDNALYNETLTVTAAVRVSGGDATLDIRMPARDYGATVSVSGDGTPPVVVKGLDSEAQSSALEERSVQIEMSVEKQDEATADQETRDAMAAIAEEAAKTASANEQRDYVNIDIEKEVRKNGVRESREAVRETGSMLDIFIPYDLTGKLAHQIALYRNHNGAPAKLGTSALSNGSYYTLDWARNLIVLHTKLFSTYAIGYDPNATAPSNTPINNNNNNNNNNYTGGGSSDSSYPVTVGQTANGTVKADRSTASAGTRVTLTVTPDNGCKVDSVTVTDKNGKSVPVTRNSDGTYRFNMPESAVTVNVTFAKKFADPAGTGVADWLNTDDHILYIRGYNEKGVSTVRPDNNITRAEAAMMFYRLLKNQDVTVTKTFTDVSEGQWYAQPIGVLASLGIVGGYGDGTFLPNRTITRAEFAKIATRFAIATGGKAQFSDVPEGHWAGGFIATAADYGWIGGYEDGTYRPDGFMTRAAAAKIINYMLGRSADREYVLANRENLVKYTDLTDPNVWYYFELVEASVAHDFTVTDGVEKWK